MMRYATVLDAATRLMSGTTIAELRKVAKTQAPRESLQQSGWPRLSLSCSWREKDKTWIVAQHVALARRVSAICKKVMGSNDLLNRR